jgi:hypothetical protein
MVKGDPKIFERARLLEVANFITQFQSHLLPDRQHGTLQGEAEEGVIVSPVDLEAVFEYRNLILEKEKLEDEVYIAEAAGKTNSAMRPISQIEVRILAGEIESINSQIQNSSERFKFLHHLLRRFEVWSTKIVAQQLFVSPTSEFTENQAKAEHCCYSPLLNLPSSKYFCQVLLEVPSNGSPVKVLPSAFHNHSVKCCSLPLVPNKNTWREFARISKMLRLLDMDNNTLEKIYASPCCMFDLKNKNRCKEQYNQHYSFRPHDLLALWVRAQRNNQAMRHLHLLFHIRTVGAEESTEASSISILGTEATIVGDKELEANKLGMQQSESQPWLGRTQHSFKAILKGNPENYAIQRIVQLSQKLEDLVKWAVTNQTIFTYRHVRYFLQTAKARNKSKRREVIELSNNPAKRMRLEGGNKESDLHDLRCACRVYILRWFARRHRKVTTVLFSKKRDWLHLDVGCSHADRANADILHSIVDEGIHLYLARPDIDEKRAYKKDRTLARIDRRLKIPFRFDYGITLYSQVQSLLEALAASTNSKQLDPGLITAAQVDLQSMCDYFFDPSTNIFDTAFKLLDSPSGSVGCIVQMMTASPSPWKINCTICNKPGDDENKLRTCMNCEQVYHKNCSPTSHLVSLSDVIRSFPPLEDLCRLRLPKDVPVPDFCMTDSVDWSIHEIVIDRPLEYHGRGVVPFGLSLTNTNESRMLFNRLNSGSGLVTDLAERISMDRRQRLSKRSCPIALSYEGFLITSTDEVHCGFTAGLRTSDLILGVELLKFLRVEDEARYSGSHDFKELNHQESIDLLKLQTTKLKVKIIRPNKNVVETAQTWYSSLKHLNKAHVESLLDGKIESGRYSSLWYCEDCMKTPCKDTTHSTQNILQEAQNCRSVLRRIAMESYALPFATESISSSHLPSLRRIDSMMTYIIDQQSSRNTCQNLSRAFLVPPWMNSGGRLDWVTVDIEKRPMELLCKAMSVIFDSNLSDVSAEKALFRHFLFTFSSWCIQALKSDSHKTIGPPEVFRNIRAPWLRPSCSVCTGRPCSETSQSLCDNSRCAARADSIQSRLEDLGIDEVQSISKALKSYNDCASLVGTTLLVLPSDPLVKGVTRVVPIDHNDRPVEFIIASYLPHEFERVILEGRVKDDVDSFGGGGGVFHLLPVVSLRQLTFLLERCQIRNSINKSESDLSWASLNVLNLDGVARYSYPEIQQKICDSIAIRHAIDTAVASKCSKEESADILWAREWTKYTNLELVSKHNLVGDGDYTSLHCSLIDSLLYGDDLSTVVGKMLSGHTKESLTDADGRRISPTRREIMPRTEKECAENFDSSKVQVGLECFNPLQKTPYDILTPDTVTTTEDFILVYSDLHFGNEGERKKLDSLLRPSRLEPDRRRILTSYESSRYILLTRSDNNDQEGYHGIGWGFEVLKWRHENVLRVGRICSRSPAESAGLRTNDIIFAIAGKKCNTMKNSVELITTMLGALSSSRVRLSEFRSDVIPMTLAVIEASKCELHSVVLCINRSPASSQPGKASASLSHRDNSVSQHNKSSLQKNLSSPQDSISTSNSTRRPVTQQISPHAHILTNRDLNPRRASPPGITMGLGPALQRAHQLANQIHYPDTVWGKNPSNSYQRPQLASEPGQFDGFNHSVIAANSNANNVFQQDPAVIAINPNTSSGFQEVLPAMVANTSVNSDFHQYPPQSLAHLHNLVHHSYDERPFLSLHYLFFPAKCGIIFTFAEASLFLECVKRKLPNLGVRLLCPRYTTKYIKEQIDIMKSWTYAEIIQIPKFTIELFQIMIEIDYKRASSRIKPETGPILFREYNFQYRMPIDRLPVDVYVEKAIKEQRKHHQRRQQQSNNNHHYPIQHENGHVNPGYHHTNGYSNEIVQRRVLENPTQGEDQHSTDLTGERIRGGGREEEQNQEVRLSLSDIPIEKWGNMPVYGFGDFDDSGQQIMFAGYTKQLTGKERFPEMTIDLDVYYIEGIGEIDEKMSIEAPTDQLYEVDRKSNSLSGFAAQAATAIRELEASNEGPCPNPATENADQAQPNDVLTETLPEANSQDNLSQNDEYELDQDEILQTNENIIDHSANPSMVLKMHENPNQLQNIVESGNQSQNKESTIESPRSTPTFSLQSHKMPGHMNLLGELPDGRGCFWIWNDPNALYISINSDDETKEIRELYQRDYISMLKKQEAAHLPSPSSLMAGHTERYCCSWGCFCEKTNDSRPEFSNAALSFESVKELNEHYAEYHSFGLESDAVELGRSGRLSRVEGGQQIIDLCADLTSAIYVRANPFFDGIEKGKLSIITTKSGLKFSKSPNGQLRTSKMKERIFLKAIRCQAQMNPAQLFHLFDRIDHLFDSETTGLFRYKNDELFQASVVNQISTESAGQDDEKTAPCELKASNNHSGGCGVGCRLCTLPWEKTLAWSDTSEQTSMEGEDVFFGAGCTLISKLIKSGGSNSDDAKALPGHLGGAKSLLLQLASFVPDSLKLSNDLSSSVDPLSGFRLWDENNFEVWKSFVGDVSNISMLAQAYITMLASIQNHRLPTWWRSEGSGWSTAQDVIANPNLSSLLLRFYVLDAAIAEFLCSACFQESAKPKARSQSLSSIKGRMEKYIKLATMLGFDRFNGVHNSDCVICEDGGSLLCCELCSNVQHAACCDPPIESSSSLDNWICDSCITEIDYVKNKKKSSTFEKTFL